MNERIETTAEAVARGARLQQRFEAARALRAELIAGGTIVPADQVMPARTHSAGPVLRLDDRGRTAAQRHLAQGKRGTLLLEAPMNERERT